MFLTELLLDVFNGPIHSRRERLAEGLKISKYCFFNIILPMSADHISRESESITGDGGCQFRSNVAAMELEEKIKSAAADGPSDVGSRVIGFNRNLNNPEEKEIFLGSLSRWIDKLRRRDPGLDIDIIQREIEKSRRFANWVKESFPFQDEAPFYSRTSADGYVQWGSSEIFHRYSSEEIGEESIPFILFAEWKNFEHRSVDFCEQKVDYVQSKLGRECVFGSAVSFSELKSEIIVFFSGNHFHLFTPNVSIPMPLDILETPLNAILDQLIAHVELNLSTVDQLRTKRQLIFVDIVNCVVVDLTDGESPGSFFQFQIELKGSEVEKSSILEGTLFRNGRTIQLLDSYHLLELTDATVSPTEELSTTPICCTVKTFLRCLQIELQKKKVVPQEYSLRAILGPKIQFDSICDSSVPAEFVTSIRPLTAHHCPNKLCSGRCIPHFGPNVCFECEAEKKGKRKARADPVKNFKCQFQCCQKIWCSEHLRKFNPEYFLYESVMQQSDVDEDRNLTTLIEDLGHFLSLTRTEREREYDVGDYQSKLLNKGDRCSEHSTLRSMSSSIPIERFHGISAVDFRALDIITKIVVTFCFHQHFRNVRFSTSKFSQCAFTLLLIILRGPR